MGAQLRPNFLMRRAYSLRRQKLTQAFLIDMHALGVAEALALCEYPFTSAELPKTETTCSASQSLLTASRKRVLS